MKYAGEQVRAWVIDKLASLTVGSTAIPVVNIARRAQEPPYVDIINQTQSNTLSKDSDSATGTVIIQCVTRYTGNHGGDAYADRIASAVSEIMTDASGTTTDFQIDVLGLDANESTMVINQSEMVITRQLAYRVYVSQLN